MYSELNAAPDKAAAATAGAAAAPADERAGNNAWTQERITAEVQSALQEVLGRSLEPEEPFMSGGQAARRVLSTQGVCEHVSTCEGPPH